MNMPVNHNRNTKLRLGALVAPFIIVLLASALSFDVANRFHRDRVNKLQDDAQSVVKLAAVSMDNYSDLLYVGSAFVQSSDSITNTEWQSFYTQQSIFERYPGVSSVSYVDNVPTAELEQFETMLKGVDYFGPSYSLKAQSDRMEHGLTRAYVTENNISGVLGIDLLTSQDRYDVYKRAEAKNAIVASPPFKLATGYDGFFTVLPVFRSGMIDGYVITSFRFQDLMRQLLTNESFGYRVTDITDTPKAVYQADFDESDSQMSQVLTVGDRSWRIEISKKDDEHPLGYLLPSVIIVTALLLATTLYAYSRRPRHVVVRKK